MLKNILMLFVITLVLSIIICGQVLSFNKMLPVLVIPNILLLTFLSSTVLLTKNKKTLTAFLLFIGPNIIFGIYFIIKILKKINYKDVENTHNQELKKIVLEKGEIFYYEYNQVGSKIGLICILVFLIIQIIFFFFKKNNLNY